MAFPGLIQKILALRSNEEAHTGALLDLAAANIRMNNRLVSLELAGISGIGSSCGIVFCHMPPEGYALDNDLRVAPVTLAGSREQRLPGAALTIVLNEPGKTAEAKGR